MNQKGFAVLAALLAKLGKGAIREVVVARDPQVLNDYAQPMIDLCQRQGISCFERSTYVGTASESLLTFAIGWRWILPDTRGLVIFHDSLLPRYRGFAPIPNALINGETVLGVTAIEAAARYDLGDILAQAKIEIAYPIKVSDAIERVIPLYLELAIELAQRFLAGKKFQSTPQNQANASYSLWRDEEDYLIPWHQDSERIKRFVDALGFPYRGASSFIRNKKVRILDACTVSDLKIENRDPGKVIEVQDGKPIVVCGQGLLQINEAVSDLDQLSILPLKVFRTRFTNESKSPSES